MISQETFKRPLSPNEYLYAASSAYFSPFAIQFLLQGPGNIQIEAFQSAVQRVSSKHPDVNLIRFKKKWRVTNSTPKISEERWQGEDTPVFRRSFSSNEIPAEIVLFHGSPLRILFRASHSLMDARGLLLWVEEIFRALRQEELLGPNAFLSDEEFLAKCPNKIRRIEQAFKFPSPLGPTNSTVAGFSWAKRELPGDYPSLVARLASLLAEMRTKDLNSPARFMIPVDLRTNENQLRTSLNMSNPLFIDVKAGETWSQIYAHILTSLESGLQFATNEKDSWSRLIPENILGRLTKILHNRLAKSNSFLATAVLSHIGKIQLADFSNSDFKASHAEFLPLDIPGAALSFVSLQSDHSLELVVSAPKAFAENRKLEDLMDLIVIKLTENSQNFGPTRELTSHRSMSHLILEQAQRTPTEIALFCNGTSLTYSELNERSYVLARQISAAQIVPGDFVAILLDRSIEMIITLLAIWRAGAAFVPLDRIWPEERILYVLQSSTSRLLVTDRSLGENLNFKSKLYIDAESSGGTNQAPTHFNSTKDTDTKLAYMIFTSGSTGAPKGVKVSHKSFANYILWAKEIYFTDFKEKANFPFFTSLSFDLTLTSIFLPLIVGGQVRIVPENDPLRALQQILSDTNINAAKMTPSHLRILQELGVHNSSISRLIIGGEALTTSLAKSVQAQNKALKIFNEYGPTEATVGCSAHWYSEQDTQRDVPIGNACFNSEILLLNEELKHIKMGQLGEICISGHCLADGYLNASNENRFISHPFRKEAKLYLTGDLGIWDGRNLHYYGRRDEQVKIRGHRIELAEIEQALSGLPGIKTCAVVTSAVTDAHLKLVAYIVWQPNSSKMSLREALSKKIPEYMIPLQFLDIEVMPLTINGKVDKARLPKMCPIEFSPSQSTEDDIEKQLLAYAGELINISPANIALDVSIFNLGFDSVLTALLFSKASKNLITAEKQLFQRSDLFVRDPTLANLARIIRELI